MRKKIETKILWQSKTYPWMVFTERQLAIYREKYPRIPKWKPLLEELEAWVASNEASNPDKIPTPKGWGNFLNNCARRRNRDIELGIRNADGTKKTDRRQSNAEYYGRGAHSAEPAQFADILKKLAQEAAA
jgi:hypothetical protein